MNFIPADVSLQKFEGDLRSFVGISRHLRSLDANLKCVFQLAALKPLQVARLDGAADGISRVQQLHIRGLST